MLTLYVFIFEAAKLQFVWLILCAYTWLLRAWYGIVAKRWAEVMVHRNFVTYTAQCTVVLTLLPDKKPRICWASKILNDCLLKYMYSAHCQEHVYKLQNLSSRSTYISFTVSTPLHRHFTLVIFWACKCFTFRRVHPCARTRGTDLNSLFVSATKGGWTWYSSLLCPWAYSVFI